MFPAINLLNFLWILQDTENPEGETAPAMGWCYVSPPRWSVSRIDLEFRERWNRIDFQARTWAAKWLEWLSRKQLQGGAPQL